MRYRYAAGYEVRITNLVAIFMWFRRAIWMRLVQIHSDTAVVSALIVSLQTKSHSPYLTFYSPTVCVFLFVNRCLLIAI